MISGEKQNKPTVVPLLLLLHRRWSAHLLRSVLVQGARALLTTKRSRRCASELAMEKLKVPVATDNGVLEVLRLWNFKSNRSRTNV